MKNLLSVVVGIKLKCGFLNCFRVTGVCDFLSIRRQGKKQQQAEVAFFHRLLIWDQHRKDSEREYLRLNYVVKFDKL